MTLYGIDYNPTTQAGTLGFVDPYGGPVTPGGNTSNAATLMNVGFITDTTTAGHVGQLYINSGYTSGAGGNPSDPDNPGDSATGWIVVDLGEAVIPEPSSLIMGATSLLAVGTVVLLRNRRAA